MGRRRRPTDDEPVNRDASTPWRCRSEEHTSELQSRLHLVCRLLLEKKKEKLRHGERLQFDVIKFPAQHLGKLCSQINRTSRDEILSYPLQESGRHPQASTY